MKGVEILMKKKLAKLLALGMSVALVFSLAACGGDESTEADTTTTEAAITTEAPAEPATGESESVSESGEQPTGTSDAPAVPTDTAGVIDLLNSAVDKIGSTSATYDRAIAKSGGAISALGYDAIKFEAEGDDSGRWNYTVLSANFDKSGEALPGDKTSFSKVDAGSVASATATDNGDTISVSISLKDTTIEQSDSDTGRTAGFGTGGYMYFINFEETASVVKNVVGDPKYDSATGTGGFALPASDKISLNKATFSLSGGKLEATIDKASGKLTKASLSFSESIAAKATYVVAPVTANIAGSGTIYYSFS